jgi:hypothetical protein
MFLFNANAAVSSANCDIFISGLLGVFATYILYSNDVRTAQWGTPACIVFHSENVHYILTLNLLSIGRITGSTRANRKVFAPIFFQPQ